MIAKCNRGREISPGRNCRDAGVARDEITSRDYRGDDYSTDVSSRQANTTSGEPQGPGHFRGGRKKDVKGDCVQTGMGRFVDHSRILRLCALSVSSGEGRLWSSNRTCGLSGVCVDHGSRQHSLGLVRDLAQLVSWTGGNTFKRR